MTMHDACKHERVEHYSDVEAYCADCGAELEYVGDGYNDKWEAKK